MKQSPHSHGPLPLLLLLVSIIFFSLIRTSRASRDPLKQTQIEAVEVVDSISQTGHQGTSEREGSTATFDILMGREECEDGDKEECLKRRMISEAHLDYIYTQRHSKP